MFLTNTTTTTNNKDCINLRFVLSHFRGDVDKVDLLGYTALHHAARAGQWNCVSFLINFGANIWKMDNDFNTAMKVAAVENRTEIMKMLDLAQTEQEDKNPKVVRQLKEKAMKDAEKNNSLYEKLQEKASRDLEKQKRQQEKQAAQTNGDFKAPSSKNFVQRMTWKMKGNTAKFKTPNGGATFSEIAGTKRGRGGQPNLHRDGGSGQFTVSEFDESGNRTTKCVRGTMSKMGGQVLYTNTFDIEVGDGEQSADPSIRPALTNVFPGASTNTTDSGIDSSGDGDEAPGLFNRPMFGKVAFMKQFNSGLGIGAMTNGDADNDGWANENGVDNDERDSNSVESQGAFGNADDQEDDEDPLDDDDDDTEYTPVMMFLEACGLLHFAHIFLQGEVDMEALMMLKNSDFNDMQIPIGPRRKLMDAIQKRRVVLKEPAQMYDSQL